MITFTDVIIFYIPMVVFTVSKNSNAYSVIPKLNIMKTAHTNISLVSASVTVVAPLNGLNLYTSNNPTNIYATLLANRIYVGDMYEIPKNTTM